MQKLLKKISQKKHAIGVIGLGYVGLPLCLRIIKKKIKVFGVDIDEDKIRNLKNGKSYISDINNNELSYFKKNQNILSTKYEILKNVDIIIICLPTPLKNNLPDLSFLEKAFHEIKKIINKNQVIILESTVYPGVTRNLSNSILKKFKTDKNIFIGYSPERENPGDKTFSYNKTPKLISGLSENCKKVVNKIYSGFTKNVVLVETIEVAEMSKLLENTYRSVNISLVNEIKMICQKLNIDVYDVINAAATKNFGFQKFVPGPGVGGHCIPIDPFYLSWIAKKNGYHSKFIRAAGEISKYVPIQICQRIFKTFKLRKIHFKKILIIGISYKQNVGDDRESPAFEIMKVLKKRKIIFDYYDPYFEKLKIGRKNKVSLRKINFKPKIIKKYDATLIITDHDNINYNMIFNNSNIIFDCRGRFKRYKKLKDNKKIIYC